MTLQPDAPETEAAPSDGRSVLSRRTVLRAGAHAAWAIPAVQVITQAPALAAVSGSKLSALVTGGPTWGATSDKKACTVTVHVTNNDTTSSTTNLKLTVTASQPQASGSKNSWTTTVTTSTTGWQVDPTGTQIRADGSILVVLKPSSSTYQLKPTAAVDVIINFKAANNGTGAPTVLPAATDS